MKYNFFECVVIEIFTNLKYFREILYMFEEWKENAEGGEFGGCCCFCRHCCIHNLAVAAFLLSAALFQNCHFWTNKEAPTTEKTHSKWVTKKLSGKSPKGRKARNQVVVLEMDGGIPNSTEATNSRVHTWVLKPFPIRIFLITD